MPSPFNSEDDRPTDSDLQIVLGDERYALWQMVARELGLLSDSTGVHWDRDVAQWVWRFTRGGETLAFLSPDEVAFTASFALDSDKLSLVEEAVGQEAAAAIRQRIGEGDSHAFVRWPVRQRRDAQLLVSILRAKARLV